jgi:hypothetical protein
MMVGDSKGTPALVFAGMVGPLYKLIIQLTRSLQAPGFINPCTHHEKTGFKPLLSQMRNLCRYSTGMMLLTGGNGKLAGGNGNKPVVAPASSGAEEDKTEDEKKED